MSGYALVGGWPASGKSTLSAALATELGVAYLSKDVAKEALMDELGSTESVGESQRLGRAAVDVVLRLALDCPGAVIDSTWFARSLPDVRRLGSRVVEIRCRADLDTVRARYRQRQRDPRHLDHLRDEGELWGAEVAPLGVGPLLEVDTTRPVDVPALAQAVRQCW